MTYKISNAMWCLRMVSRWLEPPPRPKKDDYTPSHDPDAPTFADMKRQVGKKPSTTKEKVFVTGMRNRKPS